MKTSMKITQARLKELLHYNPETGQFTWLVDKGPRAKAGYVVNGLSAEGYIVIRIDCHNYKAHRLAWLYQTGVYPEGEIDHINGIKNNNCWNNLRDVPKSHNQQNQKLSTNNSSGFKGVSFRKNKKVWRAYIRVQGKIVDLGDFASPEEAALARCKFENNSSHWIADNLQVNHTRLRELGYEV